MPAAEEPVLRQRRITIANHLLTQSREDVVRDLLAGLLRDDKRIASVHFYDKIGSVLFDQITRLPEYYIPRLEKDLIAAAARALGALRDVDIVEFGNGGDEKISIFLKHVESRDLGSIRYVPVDVSDSAVKNAAANLPRRFPGLRIHGILADFVSQVELIPGGDRSIYCLFGSTIGNLSRSERVTFCSRVAGMLQPHDRFLLGLDMVKDRQALFNAYNDSRQVTAAFNRNILNVVNHHLGTGFDPDGFEHVAFFNERRSRIEMHLRATDHVETTTPFSPRVIRVARGETIHTENSHKFTPADIQELATLAGLRIERVFTDRSRWFSLVMFAPGDGG